MNKQLTLASMILAFGFVGSVAAADMATGAGDMAAGAAKDSAMSGMLNQGVNQAVDAGAGMAKEQIAKQAQGAAGDATGGAVGGALSAAQAQAANTAVDSGAGMAKQAAAGLK